MKGVLFILPRLHTNLHGIIQELSARNFRIDTLCLNLWDRDHEWHHLVVPQKMRILGLSRLISKLFPTGTRNAFLTPGIFYAIRQIRKINPDYIIIREPYMAFAIVFSLASIFLRKKMIVYTQWSFEMSPAEIPIYFWMSLLNAGLGKNFYTTLPQAQLTSNHLANFHYIPFALQDQIKQDRHYFSKDKVNFLVVSKMQIRKRIEDVIIALTKLSSGDQFVVRVVSMKFDLEYESMLQSLIAQYGLKEHIELIFDVPHQQMNQYYLQSDVFILAAENEPCSVSQFEAMAFGNAVIISDDNYLSKYITENLVGLSYRNRGTSDLASKMQHLINNREEIVNLGTKGLRLIKEKHRPQNVVDKLVSLCT